jgi:hypothetical protein
MMRKLGGESVRVCTRCGGSAGECRCVRNAARWVRRRVLADDDVIGQAIELLAEHETPEVIGRWWVCRCGCLRAIDEPHAVAEERLAPGSLPVRLG